jgi:ribosomal protein S6--L-glutamate ligase
MTIRNVLIFTAEPRNFVPVKLKKAAEDLGLTAQILDVTKTILVEELEGNSPETFELKSGAYFVTPEKTLEPIAVDNETAVIPRLNEYHTLIKLGILKRFEKQGAYMLNSPESMELCNDKLMTQIILNSAGIKTPYSVMIQGLNEIETVVTLLEEQKKITYPFVIKTFRGTHGIGVMKVDSRSSLVSVAQTLSKEGIDFMLQEFCKHERSARIIMIGQEVLAANLRGQPKNKDEFRTNAHLGSETEKYEPSEDEVSVARRIVELFGCNFCAIDYLITEKKEIIILEVNGSPGLENIQSNYPDRDLPKLVIEFTTGKKGESKAPDTETAQAPAEKGEEPVANAEAPSEVESSNDDLPPETTKPESLPTDAIGETEVVAVHRITGEVEARIDTGAKYCSLHVDKVEVDGDWVKFKRGDVTYKVPVFKTVKIRHASLGDSVRRPVVKLDITMRGVRINQIEFTLNDRSSMKYAALIGRNALQALGLPVIVYKDADKVGDRPESEIYDMNDEVVEEEE